jgi:RNA recognition motif-containing protein
MRNKNRFLAIGILTCLMAFHLPCRSQSETKIYVGNLSYDATQIQIKEFFSKYGVVQDVRIVSDRETGTPRGFAFVWMGHGAREAVEGTDGAMFNGRRFNVNRAEPRRLDSDTGNYRSYISRW